MRRETADDLTHDRHKHVWNFSARQIADCFRRAVCVRDPDDDDAVVDVAGAPLSGTIDSVSFIGDRQRMVVSGASDKPLTVDAPNRVEVKAGERVGLSIAPEAVRLLPPED